MTATQSELGQPGAYGSGSGGGIGEGKGADGAPQQQTKAWTERFVLLPADMSHDLAVFADAEPGEGAALHACMRACVCVFVDISGTSSIHCPQPNWCKLMA
jgi:hypothetical protein